MTDLLYRKDWYAREAQGTVTGHTPEGGIILDATIFYAQGGGQPGDAGELNWRGETVAIENAVKGPGEDVVLLPAAGAPLPPVGAEVRQLLDWDRRYRHMRVHTGLHLLSVVIPLPVTGGSIGAEKGRLDFDMPEAPEDRDGLQLRLQELVDRDLPVTEEWITDADLDANPGLVKTMSVRPPMGQGRVRLIRIGTGEARVDLQPCGGTHVASTGEIGRIALGKIEKKGARNRRVNLLLAD
ncbi:alanyl-tRNA editing protein [Tropicimonas sp.]|uniref:alanyl-tRNA editing protein n=1 Tax=Tropicimonas sp. TaxID=2067044 RepID=UPI003A85EE6F